VVKFSNFKAQALKFENWTIISGEIL